MPRDVPAPRSSLEEAMAELDRAFARGRLEDLVARFADDAQVLLHEQPALEGREAIRASFAAVFEGFDTSAYEPRYEVVDVHGDRAYVLGAFEETLRPRDGEPGIRIHGRVVQFWRAEPGGAWRIVRLLTGRSAPEEPEAPDR